MTLSKTPLIYVIILNWNLPHFTINCVESVLESNYPNFKTLVVDNGSSDNSSAILRNYFENRIELLTLPVNLGFGQGNNQGIKFALQSGAEYILLINNDTCIDPNMITELCDCALSDRNIGIAGPIIYYSEQPQKIWFSGIRYWKQLYVLQRGIHLTADFEKIEDVDFISGCGMLVNRVVWEKIGLFSPEYFMYYEDQDFCLSAKKAGFRIVTATQAKMWHHIASSSGGSESASKRYNQVKSSVIFYRKHTHGIGFLVNIFLRIINAFWAALKLLLKGGIKIEVIKWYIKGIKEALNYKSV